MIMSTCLIFPPKTARDPHQRYMVANFLNRTYCVVPRRNWTKLRGLTLPLSDFLLVLCGRKDSTSLFLSSRQILENHSQDPGRQPTIFSAILHGALDRADDTQALKNIW